MEAERKIEDAQDAENDAYLNIINLVHEYAEEFGKNFGSPE